MEASFVFKQKQGSICLNAEERKRRRTMISNTPNGYKATKQKQSNTSNCCKV
jgi:hypothetical protein